MRLSEAEATRRAVISEICAPEATAAKLSAMGFTVGEEIGILRKKKDGGAVILLRGTRIALGADAAKGIMVTNVSGKK